MFNGVSWKQFPSDALDLYLQCVRYTWKDDERRKRWELQDAADMALQVGAQASTCRHCRVSILCVCNMHGCTLCL